MTPNQKETGEKPRSLGNILASVALWHMKTEEAEVLINKIIDSKTAVEREASKRNHDYWNQQTAFASKRISELDAKLTSATSEIERLNDLLMRNLDKSLSYAEGFCKGQQEKITSLELDNGRLREEIQRAIKVTMRTSCADDFAARLDETYVVLKAALALPSQSLGWLKEVKEALVLMEEHSDCASDMARCDFDHRIVWQKYEKALKLLEEGGI